MERSTILEEYIKNSTKPISLEGMIKITEQMKNSICKIYKIGIIGTGFLCNLPYNSVNFPFLITNYHILNEKEIENNKKIVISFNDENIFKDILIDESRITLTNKDLDFTIIEIKNKDNINFNNILELDENIMIEEDYINKKYIDESIYTLHYPKGDNIVASFGLIKGINDKRIYHSCCTEEGSSGAPILSLNNFKVVGIHFGFKQGCNFNQGAIIKYAIQELSKYKKNNILKEDNNNSFESNANFNFFNNNMNVNNNLFNNNMNINNINNVNEPKEKIIKYENSQSIIPFPEEKYDLYNIKFEDSSNFKTNIIIPPYKDISQLFDIYKRNMEVKDISKDEILFTYNGSYINIDQNKKIEEIFRDHSKLNVIYKK